MKSKCILVFTGLIFSFISLFAEKIPEDAGLWGTLCIEKKITQRTSISLDQELRLFDNMSRLNQYFSNLGVSYQLSKSFKVTLAYRFILKSRLDEVSSKRHRMFLDLAYKRKMNDFALTYRVRLQGQYSDYYSSETGKEMASVMRHKLDLKYSHKKFTPYVGAELFYQLSDPGYIEGNSLWNRIRYYAGTEYKINRQNSFSVYYLIQEDFNTVPIGRDFILGVEYDISF